DTTDKHRARPVDEARHGRRIREWRRIDEERLEAGDQLPRFAVAKATADRADVIEASAIVGAEEQLAEWLALPSGTAEGVAADDEVAALQRAYLEPALRAAP